MMLLGMLMPVSQTISSPTARQPKIIVHCLIIVLQLFNICLLLFHPPIFDLRSSLLMFGIVGASFTLLSLLHQFTAIMMAA